ncbi:MAG: HTH domain-containing protein, partial [Pseudomonadota bacterium]
KEAQTDIQSVKNAFFQLPEVTQQYFYKVYFHFLSFIGDHRDGLRLADQAIITIPNNFHDKRFRQAIFNKIYFSYKLQKKSSVFKCIEDSYPLSKVDYEMLKIIKDPVPTMDELKSWALSWKTEMPPIYLDYLTDVLFTKALRSGNYRLIREAYTFLTESILSRQSHAPIVEFIYYKMLYEENIGEFTNWQESRIDLKRILPDVQTEFVEAARESRSFRGEMQLIVDSENRIVLINGERIDLQNSSRMFSLIEALAQKSQGFDLYDLYRKVYGSELTSRVDEQKLEALVSRVRKLLGTQSISRTDGVISLSVGKVDIKQSSKTKKDRINEIGTFIREANQSLSADEIAKHFKISKRTNQNDLKMLVKYGAISVEGRGRMTRYSAC